MADEKDAAAATGAGDDGAGGDGGGGGDEEDEKKTMKRLEKGDYVVQVHIVEARDLVAKDAGDTSDPVCEVQVMGQKKSTAIHKETLNVIFDEMLTFEFNNLEVEELGQGRVTIEMYDANMVRSNELIGSFEFDIETVYYREHHELYQQWVGLTDVTDSNEGVQGYLQVTIVVLGPKDEIYVHDESETLAGEGSLMDVMMAPQIESHPHLLRVHCYEVDKLPIMDSLTKSSDPYIQVDFANIMNKTKVYKKSLDAQILETVCIPVMEPILSDKIIIHVKDHDAGPGSDDVIGTCSFSYKKAKKDGFATRWVHMYGAPRNKSNKMADKMNEAIYPGIAFRGSMMIRIDVQESEEPKKETIKAVWNKELAPKIKEWVIQVDCYQGVEIYDGKGKYCVQMVIRDLVIQTDWVECKKGKCEWYEVLRMPEASDKTDTIELRMPLDPSQCPDVLFYLVQKHAGFDRTDDIISYKRFKWSELIKFGFTERPHWYEFEQSSLFTKLDEEEFPGSILMGIRAGARIDKPAAGVPIPARPFLNIDASESALEKVLNGSNDGEEEEEEDGISGISGLGGMGGGAGAMPSMRDRGSGMSVAPQAQLGDAQIMGQLTVTVVNARSLPVVDRDGACDPYVEVTVNGMSQKTEVQKDTLQPTWNKSFTYQGVSVHDSIQIKLKDWNRFSAAQILGEKDSILIMGLLQEAKGELGIDFNHTKKFFVSDEFPDCVVTLSVAFHFDARQAHKRRKGKEKQKFGLFDKAEKKQQRLASVAIMGRPFPKAYKMVVYVYQARNLDAADNDGFSDPFLEVSYCGKGEKTETIKKTLNPAWMQSLSLTVDVPQPAEYAPRIRFAIYDWDRLSSNDLIGRFYVKFTDVIQMMILKKPRWYHLTNTEGDESPGRCYVAIEFIDANQRKPPIFEIDRRTETYFLHMLTIGVRGLRSALGIFKPQIVYTAPMAGDTGEIRTDPSSDPAAKDANFLVIQKIPLKLPYDYELAPVVNIAARDNLFGGVIQRHVGNAILDVQDYMNPIKDSDTNAWVIRDVSAHILNEKELAVEIVAEDFAEGREFTAEIRSITLSNRKAAELVETRCTIRDFHTAELDAIERIEKEPLVIESMEEVQERRRVREEEEQAALANRREGDRLQVDKNDPEPEEEDEEKKDKDTEEEKKGNGDGDDEEEDSENDKLGDDGMQTELENHTSSAGKSSRSEVPSESDGEGGGGGGGGGGSAGDIAVTTGAASASSADEEEEDGKGKGKSNAAGDTLEESDDEDDGGDEKNKKSDGTGTGEEETEEKKDEEEEDGKKKKKKKLSRKDKLLAKLKQEKELAAWDKEDESSCFDIDQKISVNPEDFEPDYLKGRPRIKTALEGEMEIEPFQTIRLMTGQAGGLKLFGNDKREVGKIKGLWKLCDTDQNPFGKGLASLVQTRTISVRLYVLNGTKLISTDRDNSSDPYLVIKLGKEKFSTRSRYIPNTLEPKFHEAFEFHSKLPGPSQLTVEVWDYDGIGDDLVGQTIIDIEDRWFCKAWRRLKTKPLEERTLRNPRSTASFGKLRCWVDMFTKDEARSIPIVDVSLPPKIPWEMRIIIWKAKDVVIKDTVTDQNDLIVKCNLNVDEIQKQTTDIHWRAKFGKGSWNWRMLFPIGLPFDKNRTGLQLSMWDQDIIGANDSIGEVNINLDLMLRKCYLENKLHGLSKLTLRKEKKKRFWMHFLHNKWPGEVQAKLEVSIELMTSEETVKYPAGLGRGDPNNNPFLPEPEGRLRFTLNPFSMLRQLLGDKMCFKLILICCLAACTAIMVFFGPQLFITLLSKLIVG